MKEKINPSVSPKTQREKKEKTPWLFGLEVKDLVRPINIRRVQILYAGMVLLVLAGIGYYAWDNFLRQPTGVELVNEMVEASGGMEAWNNTRQGQFTRTQNLYGQNGELLQTRRETFYFQKTDEGLKLQVKSTTNDGEEVWIGKDQEGYWASKDKKAVDPELTARGLGMMCDSKFCEPLCATSMAFYRFSMPFKLTDFGVLPDLATTNFNVLDFNPLEHLDIEPLVLDITYKPEVGRDRWRFFIDPNDKLIHKIEYYNKSDFGEIRPEEIYWSDHRKEFGITFSHKWSRYWANGQLMDEYIFSDVDFQTALADEFFERPEGHEWLSAR